MSSTVSLIQMLASGVVTSAGVPVASGLCRFYQPATLTPVTVYADTQAATPIAPPLTLTAGGTGIAYTLAPTRVIIKDSTDTTTLFDVVVNIDRADASYVQSSAFNGGTETTLQAILNGWTTAFGGSAGLWQYKATASATERNPKDVITEIYYSVKSFGAVGNGVANDTAAIQATVSAIAAAGSGGTVYFPPGSYLINSAITCSTNNVSFVGSSPYAAFIKNSSGAGNALTLTSGLGYTVRNLGITHSSSSSGSALSMGSASQNVVIDNVNITNHAKGISGGGSGLNVVIANTSVVASTTAIDVSAATSLMTLFGGSFIGATNGILVGDAGVLKAFGTSVDGGTVGIDIQATASLYAYGVTTGGGPIGLRTSATAGVIFHEACNWNPSGASTVTDQRTGAPVNYSFAANNNFTPLPAQANTIRAVTTAGGVTVTVNNPAAQGFGRNWVLICSNASAGASTFTFGANYVLNGAVTPAAGNRVALTLYYDPVTGKTYECGRGPTAN